MKAPGVGTSGSWTIGTLKHHQTAMEEWRDRFDAERDRRYLEVNIEKEKALKIKETADRDALSLAREAQAYKDQQNDALRDKNLSESGVYATNSGVAQAIGKLEQKLDPIFEFISAQKGGANQGKELWGKGTTILAMAVAAGSFIYNIIPK